MEYIAFDAHKRYTLASVVRPDGRLVREQRIAHERGALREFLERCERGLPVAVETIGNWYWIVDEIEAAGCVPQLVHARKAKLMMGEINKTDKTDQKGVMGPNASGQRLPPRRELSAQRAARQLGQDVGIAGALREGVEHGATGDPEDITAPTPTRMPRVFEHFLEPIGLAGVVADQRGAIPR
jgi:hypothetical protein